MDKKEFIDQNKKKSLVRFIKTGKKPRRHGLLLRLLDLINLRVYGSSSIFNLKDDTYNKVLKIWYPSESLIRAVNSCEFAAISNKHLGKHEIKMYKNFIHIKFVGECVDWYELDYALYQTYPGKCYEKNGAIYRK